MRPLLIGLLVWDENRSIQSGTAGTERNKQSALNKISSIFIFSV